MFNKEKESHIHIFEERPFDEGEYKKTMLTWLEVMSRKMKRLENSIECYRRFQDFDDIQHAIEDMRELRDTIHRISDVNELMSHQPNFPKDRFFESGITI